MTYGVARVTTELSFCLIAQGGWEVNKEEVRGEKAARQ